MWYSGNWICFKSNFKHNNRLLPSAIVYLLFFEFFTSQICSLLINPLSLIELIKSNRSEKSPSQLIKVWITSSCVLFSWFKKSMKLMFISVILEKRGLFAENNIFDNISSLDSLFLLTIFTLYSLINLLLSKQTNVVNLSSITRFNTIFSCWLIVCSFVFTAVNKFKFYTALNFIP